MDNDTTLKQQILDESLLIHKTVDFLEAEIDKHLRRATLHARNKNLKAFEKEKKTVKILLVKLSAEIKNMDDFMLKYRKLVQNEKKKMLSDSRQKKQVYLRSVPKNQRRKKGGKGL